MKTLELTADRPGERLDVFLSRAVADLSRSQARRLIDDGLVTVDGTPERPSYRLPGGARITATLPPVEEAEPAAERIPLTII